MFRECQTTFNLERHLIPFLQDCAFFAELSRQLTKIPTLDIPTAAVTYDPRSDQVALYYNPNFMDSLSNWEIRGVLTHEFYHLVFCHLNARRKNPQRIWNVATDLAINSIIIENAGKPRDAGEDSRDARPLPRFALVPGQWPTMPDGRELSKEEKNGADLAALIASFPKLKASEWYYAEIMKAAKNAKNSKSKGKHGAAGPGQPGDDNFGDDWIDSWDNHDAWDELPEEQREYVAGKVKSMIEKSVRHADQLSTGWGSIPQDLREDIRRSVTSVINWRSVLRQFIGNLIRGGRTTSIKRINRRYPYIHPGIKRGYVAKLLIARDESGSVSNEMLESFFGELSTLTKKVEIDFLPFDCAASEKDIVRWAKGTTPAKVTKRTKGGGTDFSAPTKIFNDPKNRGRWDGMLIMTDGQAPSPTPARGKRGWILAKGCRLEFDSNELQIFVTNEKPLKGAWR
jgi:predicted metal-dependent peptidase